MKKIKVGVVMGGESSEREVSLMTGEEMIKNLNKKKYKVVKIVLPFDFKKINNKIIDIALIALHGKGGEDGVIQGYLETLGIKYTGSGVLASAVGMNKKIFKKLMEANKILMPKVVTKSPCVVKPVNGGSSLGVSIVKNEEELETAVRKAKKYDDEVLIEEYIKGRELTCGVLAGKAMPVIEIKSKNEFFDYRSKYSESGAKEICPAKISEKLRQRIQEISEGVFELIGTKSYGRVDFIFSKGKLYMLEVNTLPGMTRNSLLPKEAKMMGMSYSQLLDKIIDLALES